MGTSLHKGRLVFAAVMVSLAFAGLAYRLVELQILRHDQLHDTAQRNTRRAFVSEPLRGQIRDIKGTPLVTSVPAKTVCVDPSLIGTRQLEVARILAPLLETNELWLVEKLQPRMIEVKGTRVIDKYEVLKRKVELHTWYQITNAMAQLDAGVDLKTLPRKERLFLLQLRSRAIFTEEDEIRKYPAETLAAHVVGYVANDENLTGLMGIEASFNKSLTGVRGWRRTELDRERREMVQYRDQNVEPRDGLNVVLTLDAGLQHIIETELEEAALRLNPISISCVAVRPKTGAIVSMATWPTYNPSNPGMYPLDHLRNRVISDQAEPGSTFKIVVVSGALNEGTVSLSDTFFCENGLFTYANTPLHDHGSHGLLTVEQIIGKSSNIGSAKVGMRLGKAKLDWYVRQYGFGVKTGIPLPGEARGTVHPLKNWYKVSIAQIPMGHGIAVTPLQMTMAMAAVANKGVLMRPLLVDRLEHPDGRVAVKYEPQQVRRVVSEKAATQTVKALRTAVLAGTGKNASLDYYSVAGKTGTAQKPINGGYVPGKFFSSFIGFLPAEEAEICLAVYIDEPRNGHLGGATAAPIFKNIAERATHYLNLKPDIFPLPKGTVTAAKGGN